eukprot:TRINITY_DN47756_c0_g1_i1.p1 TRINITY_DN47756_c0_g1~~TRINITY_DN47756_c0_g1_i1.p1  ORF type:complete len:496 (-),score=54.23 TRINITY_DN47756_c0_g1_i1:774-2261(-)
MATQEYLRTGRIEFDSSTAFNSWAQQHRQATTQIANCFKTKGWCILKSRPSNEVLRQVDTLFTEFTDMPKEQKNKFMEFSNLGYVRTETKEGLRLLSGSSFGTIPLPSTPAALRPVVRACADNFVDQLAGWLNKSSTAVFGVSKETLESHIPLLSSQQVGMFDITLYHNEQSSTVPNCAEHIDPGLVVWSRGATAPGLELWDPQTRTWVAPAPEEEVLWCGKLAEKLSGGVIQPALHRVVHHPGGPRLTMWFEVCDKEQIPRMMNEVHNKEGWLKLTVDVKEETPQGEEEEEEYWSEYTGNPWFRVVPPHCTVAELVHSLPQYERYPTICQLENEDGTPLKRHLTLAEQGVESGATLYVHDRDQSEEGGSFELTVKMIEAENTPVWLRKGEPVHKYYSKTVQCGPLFPDSTILDFKVLMEWSQGVPWSKAGPPQIVVDGRILVESGDDQEEIKDHNTMAQLQLGKGSVLAVMGPGGKPNDDTTSVSSAISDLTLT